MDAVIFDMDGVLVDSVRHWQEERRRVIVDELGLESVDVDDLVGMNTHDEYELLAGRYDIGVTQDEYVDRLSEEATTIYADRVDLLSGLHDLLHGLADRGVTLGLATSSYRRRADVVMDRFDLDEAFDAVVTSEDVAGGSKPAPDIYVEAAAALGVDPGRCVAVEDSRNGAVAATRAGMYCVGYAGPEAPEQDLDVADEVVSSPAELADRLPALVAEDA